MMAIIKHWKDVYDSVVNVNHTADVLWQTALNVTGKGKAEIHLSCNDNYYAEIRITLDGNVLTNGLVGQSRIFELYRFEEEWNKTLLVEYRTNDAGQIAYVIIHYYNH